MTPPPRGLAALLLSAAAGVCTAQPNLDLGKAEYEASCASCHGASGKGDGAVAPHLIRRPADLTAIAARNSGVFPSQLVWEVIDGRGSREIGPHGSREMPIWGVQYRLQAIQLGQGGVPEWYVRGRIVALLDYLARLQAK
ncbi:MAG: cytochrome c [Burkholderiales bacterium]|nr:cytochrome c [Burkholderiales bacterium]